MAQVKANGIDIEVERFGPKERDCVLLIMGVGAQMTLWPTELCEELVARGYVFQARVVEGAGIRPSTSRPGPAPS